MDLVLLLQAAQDGDGIGHARLTDQDRLKATLEGGVLLDVLAVLVERRGADDPELAPSQRRLEHVARVDRAFGGAGAHDGVQLVDEGDVLPFTVGQLLDHRLQPLLELAAELGAGEQLGDVERHQLAVAQRRGHVAVHDPLGQSLDDGGLADTGLADQHRVVLGPPRQYLHHPAHFFIAPDHGIELPPAREVGEVAGVPLERLVLLLGRLVGDAVGAAHLLERAAKILRRHVLCAEHGASGGALLLGQRQEEVLGRHVGVGHLPRIGLGTVEDPIQLPAERRLGTRALLLRKAAHLPLDLLHQRGEVHPGLLQQRLDHALRLLQQGQQQMRVVDDRIASTPRLFGRVAKRLLRLDGHAIRADHERPLINSG